MATTQARVLEPGDEEALDRFLVERIETSMIMLSNLRDRGLIDTGETFSGTYAAAFEDGEIVAAAANYWNGNLALQAPRELTAAAGAAIAASGRPVGTLIGPEDQVAEALAWMNVATEDLAFNERELLFSLELEQLTVPDLLQDPGLRVRRIDKTGLDLVVKWLAAYYVELTGAVDGPQLRDKCRELMEGMQRRGHTWVMERDGEAVAMTSFNAAVAETVQVGGVYTPPELRGRGYGRAIVAAQLRDVRAEGVPRAVLFTGEHNLAAQRAYEPLGFRRIGALSLVALKTPFQPGAT